MSVTLALIAIVIGAALIALSRALVAAVDRVWFACLEVASVALFGATLLRDMIDIHGADFECEADRALAFWLLMNGAPFDIAIAE